MPKRKSSSTRLPLWLGIVAGVALLLFAAGELWAWFASDAGRLMLARTMHLGDRAHLVRIVGKHAHTGLALAGVPRDSVRESVAEGDGDPVVRWRVGLGREGSPMQVNWAVTHALEQAGAQVMSARERSEEGGGLRVVMSVGVGGRRTHEIVLVREGRVVRRDGGGKAVEDEAPAARIALVLYGFTEEAKDLAQKAAKRSEMFALALPAGQPYSRGLFGAARETHREVVVQIPMEPENYPRTTPGSGALLVSMAPGQIQSLTRRYLEEGGQPVAVSNLMGSFASQDEPLVNAMYRELKKAGVTFLHVQPAPRSVCKSLASQQGVAYDEPDALLDDSARGKDTKALDRDWKAVLERAGERGHALVMLRATPMSLKWLDGALAPSRMGRVRLVPLSQVIRRPGAV